MKVLAINSSARKDGNTAFLINTVFEELKKEGIYSDIATEVIRPSAQECAMNSRARSAKLRWAVRA